MNCEEFRHGSQIDPLCEDASLREHEAQCPACAEFARELRAREIRLRALLREVSAPDALTERVVAAVQAESREERWRQWGFGVAAAMLLLITASYIHLQNGTGGYTDNALITSVLTHIEAESHHLHDQVPVAGTQLAALFERFGASLTDTIGQINFAAECLMREHTGIHLIMSGERGPVSIFFMPGEFLSNDPGSPDLAINADNLNGTVLPTNWGSLAVVGEHGEKVAGLAKQLLAATRWPSSVSNP